MGMFRLAMDQPYRKKIGQDRADDGIVFVVALDSCRADIFENVQGTWKLRKSENRSPTSGDLQDALAVEVAPGTAPERYSVVFSCARSAEADDGVKGGHSPSQQATRHRPPRRTSRE